MRVFRLARLLCLLLLGLALASCGQASPTPTPGLASPAADSPDRQNALLDAWKVEFEKLASQPGGTPPAHPPLSSLTWRPLRAGMTVGSDCVILTDEGAAVSLLIPTDAFQPAFLAAVRNGTVVGYRVEKDGVRMEIGEMKIFPFRATPSEFLAPDKVQARVVEVNGLALLSTDVDEVRRDFATLVPQTMRPPKEALVPAPGPTVHVRKGLGFRGKDLATLPTSVVRSLVGGRRVGVYVDEVFPDSPADRAKLRKEDVIQKLGGTEIRSSGDLRVALEKAPAGKAVPLVVYRQSSAGEVTLQITPGQFEGDANYVSPRPVTPSP